MSSVLEHSELDDYFILEFEPTICKGTVPASVSQNENKTKTINKKTSLKFKKKQRKKKKKSERSVILNGPDLASGKWLELESDIFGKRDCSITAALYNTLNLVA